MDKLGEQSGEQVAFWVNAYVDAGVTQKCDLNSSAGIAYAIVVLQTGISHRIFSRKVIRRV